MVPILIYQRFSYYSSEGIVTADRNFRFLFTVGQDSRTECGRRQFETVLESKNPNFITFLLTLFCNSSEAVKIVVLL